MCRKNLKKIWLSFLVILFTAVGYISSVRAEEIKVDYKNETVVDSDFDGLTDQGEVQLYKTNPNAPDSDRDGFYDGAEVLKGTDPLNLGDPVDFDLTNQIREEVVAETPWAWYVTRSAGLLGFFFLWLSVFLGLSIRNNWLKKMIEPIYSFGFHCFLGTSALFWALMHGASILFDQFFGMKILDVVVPFHFKYPNFVIGGIDYLSLGIIAFYAMIILVVTSYAKNIIHHKIWRALHFLNPLAFIFVVLHGYFIGTDMHNIWVKNIFLGSSVFLVLMYLSNLFFVLWNNWHSATPAEELSAKQ